MKAGKIASGEFASEKAVKSGDAYLVILSEDASQNTKKKFQNMADWRSVPTEIYLDKQSLGRYIGKGERSVLAVLDKNFAGMISMQIRQERSVS